MAVFRVERNTGYTVMSNHHFYWSFCHIHSPDYILLFPFPVGYAYTIPTMHQNNS